MTNGDFLAAADLSSQPSTTGKGAVAVQNLFYLHNLAHDTLYRHGFTEAAGNLRADNLGNGGAGGDPVLAVASPADACTALAAGSLTGRTAIVDRGTCNFTVKVLNAQSAGARAVLIANDTAGAFGAGGTDRKVKIASVMVSQADGGTLKALAGSSSVLHRKSVVPLMVDGDLDSSIVFHEYGHGLTWRMIGGMSGPLAGAVGEGASDVNAFLTYGDDGIGEYAAEDAAGIRRHPYGNYPLTYGSVLGTEVHDEGEVYAAAMWTVLQNYLAAGLRASDA